MRTNKRTNRGFFLSVSALSAVGLLAASPLLASAQTVPPREDAAAETSPASPVMQGDTMMPSSGGNVTNTQSDEMMEVQRDNSAAETSPASPVMQNGTMMPSGGGNVTNTQSDEMMEVQRDNSAAETSPASPVMQNGTMTPRTGASPSGSGTAPASTSNSPRALW